MSSDPVKHTLPPFMDARDDLYEMYIHLPYVKDVALCTSDMIKPVTGNVIKYFTVQPEEPAVIDSNELVKQLIRQAAAQLPTAAQPPEAQPALDEDIALEASPLLAEQNEAAGTKGKTAPPKTPASPKGAAANESTKGSKGEKSSKPLNEKSIKDAFADFDEEDEDDFSFLRKNQAPAAL